MNKIKMMDLLIDRIKHCHKQLMSSKNNMFSNDKFTEGFRCRLDELILYYHLVRGISFCEACKELEIPYKHVNVLGDIEGFNFTLTKNPPKGCEFQKYEDDNLNKMEVKK